MNIVLSSPYKKAVDTLKEFSDNKALDIRIIEDFKKHNKGCIALVK